MLSMRKYLTLGQDYVIHSSSPFAFEIRPNTNHTVPRSRTLVGAIVRTAIRDGNSVVLALKKFLVAGDECLVHIKNGFLLVIRIRSVEIEKYVRHLASMHPTARPVAMKLPILNNCPKCGSIYISRCDGNFSCMDCKYTISAPVPLNQHQLSRFFVSS